MNTGLRPRRFRDHKRYSYPLTFGTVTTPTDFTVDKGLTNPNQNEPDPYFGNPPLPNGCTGFATADVGTNDDGIIYDPKFTYDKTLLIQNGQDGDQCTLEDSMKSALVFGLRAKGETEKEALNHRRGPYFEVHPVAGQDWFDALASAAFKNKKPVSCGTPWTMWFNGPPESIVTYVFPKNMTFRNGHDWCFSGVKLINRKEYARVKSWQGKWLYFSRESINSMFVPGSDALTCSPVRPEDIVRVKLGVMQVLLSLLYRQLFV